MAPPSVLGAVLGALLADDVSERLLYGAIAAVLVGAASTSPCVGRAAGP
jgi:uncharacterized membrane protein YfcA